MTANPSKPRDKDKEKPRIPSSETRRANKPLMEKRRRARINQSLSILKTLIVDTSREKKPSKLEKADILEFTVSYLQKNQSKSPDLDDQRFTEGYQECTKAALKFLESCNIDQSTLENLVKFLRFRRQSTNKTPSCETTTPQWDSFSKTRKRNQEKTSNTGNKCHRIVSDSDSCESTSQSIPLTSQIRLDLKELTRIQTKSSKISSAEPLHLNKVDVSFPLDLNPNLTDSSMVNLPSPDNLKSIQLRPVDLSQFSKEICLSDQKPNFTRLYPLNNTNPSNLSISISGSVFESCDNYNIDLPLDLCSKYSNIHDGHGVWRPW